MEILSDKKARPLKEKLLYMSCLVVLGVAVNFCGLNLADRFAIPFYLDTIGTFIAAYLGGYIPGILVGLIGSLIGNISDPMSVSYGVPNVLLAVLTVFFRKRGVFKSAFKSFLSIFVFAFISGILGNFITGSIYGIEYEGVAPDLRGFLSNYLHLNPFMTRIVSDYLVDFADKSISVIILFILERVLSDSVKDMFYFYAWRQAPLSEDAINRLNERSFNSKSLRSRINLLIAFASILTAASAVLISLYLYRTSVTAQHEKYANTIAKAAALAVDGDMVRPFIATRGKDLRYEDTRKLLSKVVYNTDDLEYLYVYSYVGEATWTVVFDIDNNGVKAEEPGVMVEFEQALLDSEDKIKNGEKIECFVTDDEYGWLMTAMEPIKNSKDETVAYACADIDMNPIEDYGRNFFINQITLFLGVFIFIFAIGLTFAEYNIVYPLNSMAFAASDVSGNSEEAIKKTAQGLKKLDIHTGDEIENLYHAFCNMTESNISFIEDISSKNEIIGKMQNSLIRVLADMVESRDHNTGDHIMKTAEYAKIIMEEMKKEGIYKDQLTDDFIENVYLSTPLHDIGKISISDRILNKNGKLTDEEFKIMQTHSRIGASIIDRVIATVPGADNGYLKEAKNLALYHHEKWTGGGYPMGLKGEEIPLSARIMAVADVFDALVSERSYKKAFPFEKAIGIIRESAGTHFDPNVARAFLNAEDKVREVAEASKK